MRISIWLVGFVVLALGSPWLPGYAARIRKLQAELQVRFALTVYDIIPLLHPEWCHTTVTDHFGDWLNAVLPLCDHVFAISRSTAKDLERYAARKGIALRSRVTPFPIGTGFHAAPRFLPNRKRPIRAVLTSLSAQRTHPPRNAGIRYKKRGSQICSILHIDTLM